MTELADKLVLHEGELAYSAYGEKASMAEGVDRVVISNEPVEYLDVGGDTTIIELRMAAPLRIEKRGTDTIAMLGDEK